MAVAGTCPGTILAQLGSGQLKTLVTLAGALVGAMANGLLGPYLSRFSKVGIPGALQLYEITRMHPAVTTTAMVVMFGGLVVVVSLVPGWYNEMPGTGFAFTDKFWPPVLGGAIVGLLQWPLVLGVGKNVGASTAFSVIGAAMMPCVRNSTVEKYRNKSHFWQVIFVLFAVAGGALAAWSGDNFYSLEQMREVTYAEAFIGGFLILFGSRMGAGCTSGHGITGVGHQSITSLISTAMIFVGGIATAFVFYA